MSGRRWSRRAAGALRVGFGAVLVGALVLSGVIPAGAMVAPPDPVPYQGSGKPASSVAPKVNMTKRLSPKKTPIFQFKGKYWTQDVDGHNGGVWKGATTLLRASIARRREVGPTISILIELETETIVTYGFERGWTVSFKSSVDVEKIRTLIAQVGQAGGKLLAWSADTFEGDEFSGTVYSLTEYQPIWISRYGASVLLQAWSGDRAPSSIEHEIESLCSYLDQFLSLRYSRGAPVSLRLDYEPVAVFGNPVPGQGWSVEFFELEYAQAIEVVTVAHSLGIKGADLMDPREFFPLVLSHDNCQQMVVSLRRGSSADLLDEEGQRFHLSHERARVEHLESIGDDLTAWLAG